MPFRIITCLPFRVETKIRFMEDVPLFWNIPLELALSAMLIESKGLLIVLGEYGKALMGPQWDFLVRNVNTL